MYFWVLIIEHKDFSTSTWREPGPLWWHMSSTEDGVSRSFAEDLSWFSEVSKNSFTLCNISDSEFVFTMVIQNFYIFNKYTLLQSKRGRWFRAPQPHRSFENQWRNVDILYIMLKGIIWRFRFSLNFSKIFWFRDFMSKFSRNDSRLWTQVNKTLDMAVWNYRSSCKIRADSLLNRSGYCESKISTAVCTVF